MLKMDSTYHKFLFRSSKVYVFLVLNILYHSPQKLGKSKIWLQSDMSTHHKDNSYKMAQHLHTDDILRI